MRGLLMALLCLAPAVAFAAGGGSDSSDDSPPKKTETTIKCKDGKVWDKIKKKCVEVKKSELDDDTLYKAARELAYDGQYDHSLKVLAAMSKQSESRVLTYYGFNHRKAGRVNLGNMYYQMALAINPDNLLVRSYMGQGYVESGNLQAAKIQLVEIRRRGGDNSWPEISLDKAIDRGEGYSY